MPCSLFFNDTATTEIYTLSLHDALPILTLNGLTAGAQYRTTFINAAFGGPGGRVQAIQADAPASSMTFDQDRKSTRLNSSHANISYAVFCLKKKTLHVTWSLAIRR